MMSLSIKHTNYQNELRKFYLEKSIKELREQFEKGLHSPDNMLKKQAQIFCFSYCLKFKNDNRVAGLQELGSLVNNIKLLSPLHQNQVLETLIQNRFDELLFKTIDDNFPDAEIVKLATELILKALQAENKILFVNFRNYSLIVSLLRTYNYETFKSVLDCITQLISKHFFLEEFIRTGGFEKVKMKFERLERADPDRREMSPIIGSFILLSTAIIDKYLPEYQFCFNLVEFTFFHFPKHSKTIWKETLTFLEKLTGFEVFDKSFMEKKLQKKICSLAIKIAKIEENNEIYKTLQLIHKLAICFEDLFLNMIFELDLEDFFLKCLQKTFKEANLFVKTILPILNRFPNQVDLLFRKRIYEQIMKGFDIANSENSDLDLIQLIGEFFDRKFQLFIDYAIADDFSLFASLVRFFEVPASGDNKIRLLKNLCSFFSILTTFKRIDRSMARRYAEIAIGFQSVSKVLNELANSSYNPIISEQLILFRNYLLDC